MNITQAFIGNVGTYDSDVNGKATNGDPMRVKYGSRV